MKIMPSYHVPPLLGTKGRPGGWLSMLFSPACQGKFAEYGFFLAMVLAPTLWGPVSYSDLSSVI